MVEAGTIFSIALYFISGIVLLFVMQQPVRLLQAVEPKEYERAVGDLFSILTWKAIPFAYYLASGEYKKNIQSADIVQKFTVSMWVARIQLISLVAFCLFLFNRA